MIPHIPLQFAIGFLFGHFRYLQSLTADKRIELMDQIIRDMRVIKLYVWESPFLRYIRRIRSEEVRYAGFAVFCRCITFSLFNSSLFIALFLVYIVSIAINAPLNSSQLAFAYILFNKIRFDLILYVGNAILTFRELVETLGRIQNILELPETHDYGVAQSSPLGDPSIDVTNFSASWKGTEEKHSSNLVLECINLTVEGAQLVAIAGPLGSGKSSLLMSLINELPGLSGQISLNGSSSYAAQQPWIFSGTFRDNILLGNSIHSQRTNRQ